MMSSPRLTRSGKSAFGWFAACLVAACLVTGQSAAQDRLPPGFGANPDAWTAEERAAATAFVDQQIALILSGEETQIAVGKETLLRELTAPGQTDRFLGQFSELVAGKLGPVVASEQLIVRINGIYICANLKHPDVLGPIEKGLTDDSAGVRYHAANAARQLLAGDVLTGRQADRLLDELEALAIKENNVFVVQPMLEALSQANNDLRVLKVLNARVAWHAANPAESYDAEADTLQAVYTRLFTAPTRQPAEVKELARASARYMLLTGQQMAAEDVPVDRNRSHKKCIEVAASALPFAYDALGVTGIAPSPPDPNNPPAVVNIATEWMAILRTPSFGFTDEELTVSAGVAQAAEQ